MNWILQNRTWLFDGVGGLLLVAVGGWLIKRFLNTEPESAHLWNVLARRWAIRKERARVAKDIPSMTPKERQIIGYLLANKQKMFSYTADGGYANTLISRRIVVCALLPGQDATAFGVTFEVPDHVWDVLAKHKAEFPHTWKPGEPFPWSISWMAR